MNYGNIDFLKAIVRYNGEIVTIFDTIENNDRTYYTTYEYGKSKEFIPDELRIIEDPWPFITEWLPDYYHDEDVATSDDIECCISGEADEEKMERVKEEFGDSPEKWLIAQLEIDANLLEDAVDNFYQTIYHRPRPIKNQPNS